MARTKTRTKTEDYNGFQKKNFTDVISYLWKPSILQTTAAALLVKESSQTVPHVLLW